MKNHSDGQQPMSPACLTSTCQLLRERNRGDLRVVVKLMLPGVLGQVTSSPSSGDPRTWRNFGVGPTTTRLLAGVERHPPHPKFNLPHKKTPSLNRMTSFLQLLYLAAAFAFSCLVIVLAIRDVKYRFPWSFGCTLSSANQLVWPLAVVYQSITWTFLYFFAVL